MTTYEKIVKGATKLKVAAPKPKYIEPILMATSMNHQVASENLSTIMKTLALRLQDSLWLVVYKALIVIHIMIREGDRDVALTYLTDSAPSMLQLSHSPIVKGNALNSDVRYIVKYLRYLQTRVKGFGVTGVDYVRDERVNNLTSQLGGRLRTLSVEKGLLRECENVQKQIDALLRNSFMEGEIKNDIVLTAFRLLVNDLLALFQELNEGVINLLEHYFEMFHNDAERALTVYKKFVDQTKYVIDYLRVAKHLEYATKLHVPTIKHAPTALTSLLEEYLTDPNFEENRRQYIAEKSAKDLAKQGNARADPAAPAANNASVQAPSANVFSQQHAVVVNGQRYLVVEPLLAQQATQNTATYQGAAGQNGQMYSVQTPGAMLGLAGMNPQQTVNPWGAPAQVQPQQTQQFQQQQQPQQPQQPQQMQQMQFPSQATQPQMQQSQQSQQLDPFGQLFTGQYPPQQQQLTSSFTGQGFGGYGVQPQQQATGSNPFLESGSLLNLQSAQNLQNQNTQSLMRMQTMSVPVANGQPLFLANQQFPQSASQSHLALPQGNLQRQNTNPFSPLRSSITGNAISINASNPFENTRFANKNTTALSFQRTSSVEPIQASATGRNPFQVSQTTSNVFNQAENKPQQTLRPQATAGGLENLPHIAVFPQTQQEQVRNAYLQQAQQNLMSQSNWQQQQQQLAHHMAYNGPSLI